MAEGPRYALVSRNSATTKYPYRMALFVWSYVKPFLPRDSYANRGICRRRVSVCVCVCVCLLHTGIVSKRLNVTKRYKIDA